MPDTEQEYLARAREYRRLADREGDPVMQRYLMTLAEQYEEEARDLVRSAPQTPSDQ